jgi:hypothetical protein
VTGVNEPILVLAVLTIVLALVVIGPWMGRDRQ